MPKSLLDGRTDGMMDERKRADIVPYEYIYQYGSRGWLQKPLQIPFFSPFCKSLFFCVLQEVLQAVGLTEKNFAFDSAIFHHMSNFFGKRQSFSAAIRIFPRYLKILVVVMIFWPATANFT